MVPILPVVSVKFDESAQPVTIPRQPTRRGGRQSQVAGNRLPGIWMIDCLNPILLALGVHCWAAAPLVSTVGPPSPTSPRGGVPFSQPSCDINPDWL